MPALASEVAAVPHDIPIYPANAPVFQHLAPFSEGDVLFREIGEEVADERVSAADYIEVAHEGGILDRAVGGDLGLERVVPPEFEVGRRRGDEFHVAGGSHPLAFVQLHQSIPLEIHCQDAPDAVFQRPAL